MNYIVLDLEWNGKGFKNRVKASEEKKMRFEIIEIGAVKLNEQFQKIAELDLRIKPVLYKKLSKHVAKVTGLKEEMLNGGESFKKAYQKLKEFCDQDDVFVTWSDSDAKVLLDNIHYHKGKDDILNDVINLQLFFAKEIECVQTMRTLSYAIEFFQLEEPEHYHQAISDARATAAILQKIADCVQDKYHIFIRKFSSYKHNPKQKTTIVHAFPYQKNTKEAWLFLKDVDIICPICQVAMGKEMPWMRSGKQIIADFNCEQHGVFRAKVKKNRLLTGEIKLTLKLKKVLGK